MSRIGKLPITVPSGVDVAISGGVVRVKGPKAQRLETDDVPDGFERVSTWMFVGQGYLDLDSAAAAVTAATLARTRTR